MNVLVAILRGSGAAHGGSATASGAAQGLSCSYFGEFVFGGFGSRKCRSGGILWELGFLIVRSIGC